MVHQHFMLVPVLTVAENIVLGEETTAGAIFLDRKEAHRRIVELGRRFGFEVDPETKVGSLSVGWQQRVEILKALYRDAQILVLDEPTAVLTPQETEEIFEVLRRLAAEGHSIVFISHKLYEVLEIADRITVIRRGKVVGQRIPTETNEEDLAELMVGREVSLTVDRGESQPGRRRPPGRRACRQGRSRVRRSCTASTSRSARARSSASPASPATARTSWSRRSSGCASRRGARSPSTGRDITGQGSRAVYGAAWPTSRPTATASASSCRSHRRQPRPDQLPPPAVRARHPAQRRGDPARRPRSGSRRSTSGRRRPTPRPRRCPAATSRRSSSPASSSRDLRLLVLDQPTRGLDVGSIEFIHRQAIAKRDAGTAILLVSAELDEVLELSDRIAVMYRGQLVGLRRRPDGRQERGRAADGDRRAAGRDGPAAPRPPARTARRATA